MNKKFPAYYCKKNHIDVILQTNEIVADETNQWLIIGYPGVDGIEFRVKKNDPESTIYAYYPIEDEHIKIADSAKELIQKWKDGKILL